MWIHTPQCIQFRCHRSLNCYNISFNVKYLIMCVMNWHFLCVTNMFWSIQKQKSHCCHILTKSSMLISLMMDMRPSLRRQYSTACPNAPLPTTRILSYLKMENNFFSFSFYLFKTSSSWSSQTVTHPVANLIKNYNPRVVIWALL